MSNDTRAQTNNNQSGSPRRQSRFRVLGLFQEFAHAQASSGIVLLACVIVALVWANSPFGSSYYDLWHLHLAVKFGNVEWLNEAFDRPLEYWINDGLMAIFFFVVGLEIKREVIAGELASPRKAMLPIMAAIGGMVVPAAIFLWFNLGGPGQRGWGIPMATDIAFTLGVMAVLGSRVPTPIKVFLTALAIVDDIGAVLVIAIFYTSEISLTALGIAAVFVVLMIAANRLGVRSTLVYFLLGACGLWPAFIFSGVHPTVAGVIAAFTIPAWRRIDSTEFTNLSRVYIDEFDQASDGGGSVLVNEEQVSLMRSIERTALEAQSPLQRFENTLHPWTVFSIMPLFALANAGVSISADFTSMFEEPLAQGVALGLLVGKPLGIMLFSVIAVRLGLASLPSRVRWAHVLGAGCLAGIGFTMSLFIANLALGGTELLEAAKISILVGSLLAAVLGWLVFQFAPLLSRKRGSE
ncbi:MAG: Na+/H+ antiporter NhaA [Chloroflexota bacterium]|nr:Na+/H+ antiporter NhaA [Chloroflexota bacterium]